MTLTDMTSTERLRRVSSAVILGVGIVLVADGAARGQTYAARGAAGFLQEWEIKASLAKTAIRTGDTYTGAFTLRHTGLCSANGIEEKSGTIDLKVLPKTSDIEGTMSLPDDQCRINATAAQHYSGLLTCKSGDAIPIKLSIEAVQADRTN